MTMLVPALSPRQRAFACALACALIAIWGATTNERVEAASSSTVVSATVPSATFLDTSACDDPGTPGVLSFGTVLPNTPARTGDCVVTWSSSNNTAALRLGQEDGTGSAFWAYGDGSPDAAFGTAPYAAGSGRSTWAQAGNQAVWNAEALADGDVLLSGHENWGAMYFARWDLATGALDPTFDGPGAPGNGRFTIASSFSTGSTLVDGTRLYATEAGESGGRVQVHALNVATGATDGTWGTAGVAQVDFSTPPYDYARTSAVDVDSQGRVYVVGCIEEAGPDPDCNAPQGAFIARFTPTGQPDVTWDGDGFLRVAQSSDLYAVHVDPADRIVVAGRDFDVTPDDGFIARFLPTGVLDTAGFASPTGWRSSPLAAPPGGFAVDSATEDIYLTATDGRITRMSASGALDATWGVAGIANPGVPATTSIRPRVLDDGTIMIAVSAGGWPQDEPAVIRLTRSGALDASFDGDGVLHPDLLGSGLSENVVEPLVLPDGGLALAGVGDPSGSNEEPFVHVLDSAGSVSDYAGGANWGSAASTSMFGVCLKSTTNSTADWTVNAACPTTDGAYWRGVPAALTTAAHTTGPSVVNAASTFTFGFRPADDQPAARYGMRLRIELVAPAV
jgi:uncharacterized delta-60 repeat protein